MKQKEMDSGCVPTILLVNPVWRYLLFGSPY